MYPGWGAYPGYVTYLPPAPDPRPTSAVEYPQLLRGPVHHWWRPLASFGLIVVELLGMMIAVAILMGVTFAATGQDPEALARDVENIDMGDPLMFTWMNIPLILLIPIVLVAVKVAHGQPIGYVSSVIGRFRWRWFAICVAALAPLWLVYIAGAWAIDGAQSSERPAQWPLLILLVLVLTPFQCAGEEYAFRGWLLQSVGSWFRNRVLAFAVPTVLSMVLFALAHGSLDPWLLAELGVFAFFACLLTLRTGGLEAAVAMHLVNNVILMIFTLIVGGFDDGFVDANSGGIPSSVLVSIVVQSLAFVIITKLANRQGIDRRYTPASTIPAPAPSPPSPPPPAPVSGPAPA